MEHHGPVNKHKREKNVHRGGDPSWPGRVSPGTGPPPKRVRHPDGHHGVVEIDASAPRDSDQISGLSGGVFIGLRVAPVMMKMKGEQDMGQTGETPDSPERPGDPPSPSRERGPSAEAQTKNKTKGGQPDTRPRQYVSDFHWLTVGRLAFFAD